VFCHERQEEILECGLLVTDWHDLDILHLEVVFLEREVRRYDDVYFNYVDKYANNFKLFNSL
jgi:hypothetical protein